MRLTEEEGCFNDLVLLVTQIMKPLDPLARALLKSCAAHFRTLTRDQTPTGLSK